MTGGETGPTDIWQGSAGPAAAVVVAGGRGSRLGGQDKPSLRLGAHTLLEIALTAVGDCPVVVVGPDRELPAGVIPAVEDPPGGGPAAAVAAGVTALPGLPDDALVAVLAADLPGITPQAIDRLCAALTIDPDLVAKSSAPQPEPFGGALLVDSAGRRQYLAGVWRLDALATAVRRRPHWHGAALRELLAPIRTIDVAGSENETADVDTPADWRRWHS